MLTRCARAAMAATFISLLGCSEVPDSAVESFTNSLGMDFRRIRATEFTMGIPDGGDSAGFPSLVNAPSHDVEISGDFYIACFEVTQFQYETVMGDNPSWQSGELRQKEDPYRKIYQKWRDSLPETSLSKHAGGIMKHYDPKAFPVENVTWYEAREFCKKISALEAEKSARRTYRLPTEAEWELVCREGRSEPFVFIRNRDENDTSGDNAKKNVVQTIPIIAVGSFEPNAFGIYDMRGNVWEWCSDWYARDYYSDSPRTDPKGPKEGQLKVVRCSDSRFVGELCKAGFAATPPWRRNAYIGFRVVCEIRKSLE